MIATFMTEVGEAVCSTSSISMLSLSPLSVLVCFGSRPDLSASNGCCCDTHHIITCLPNTHARTHAHTHTHRQTCTHARARTHTHTHTNVCVLCFEFIIVLLFCKSSGLRWKDSLLNIQLEGDGTTQHQPVSTDVRLLDLQYASQRQVCGPSLQRLTTEIF